MDFQVVVLAGGPSKQLAPLVSKEVPKALLPVANRPVLSYVLELLESIELKDLIVVLEGEDAAPCVGWWISGAYVDRLHVEVAAVPEDIGAAGALRAVAHHLTANDVLVVSGDLVTDVSPSVVAATHRRHGAVVTALLCDTPVSGPLETGSSGGKDKAKKPARCNVVGLDSTRQFLLHIAAVSESEKDIRVQRSILCAAGENCSAGGFGLEGKVSQQDVLPYLVRTQLRSEIAGNEIPKVVDGWSNTISSKSNLRWLSQYCEIAPSAFLDHQLLGVTESIPLPRTHKCCAYIASKSKYCARLNSIQAFSDINRDVVGEGSHLSGYSFSPARQSNIVHPSAELGSKTTVGAHCMVAEGSKIGDKCSVKRSVIGRHCRIGSNVKIVNSVVLNHVTIEDGCLVQGSVICSNVQVQERVVLKDCQVGAGYVVTLGSEHKSESLTRK